MTKSRPKTTSQPTAQHFQFARLYWEHGSASKAGKAMWPDLKAAGTKGTKWYSRPDVKLAIEAVREAAEDRIRAEYLENDCGLTDIIKLITARLKDRETPAREFKELAIYALDMQGHAPKKASKERPASGNALAGLIAQSAGFGAALGASIPDRGFPAVHAVFPEDKDEGARDSTVRALAPPVPDVAGPRGPARQ